MQHPVVRVLATMCGVVLAILGIVGVFVPVLPTTPLLLLATFLLARSSVRLNTWLQSTKTYQNYVVPFKEKKGIEARIKVRILLISLTVMGISAFVVRDLATWNVVVWVVLSLVTLWLLYLMCIRIPTLEIPAQMEAEQENTII